MSKPRILSVRQVAWHLKTNNARVVELCASGKLAGWQVGQAHRQLWRVAKSEMKRAKKAKIA